MSLVQGSGGAKETQWAQWAWSCVLTVPGVPVSHLSLGQNTGCLQAKGVVVLPGAGCSALLERPMSVGGTGGKGEAWAGGAQTQQGLGQGGGKKGARDEGLALREDEPVMRQGSLCGFWSLRHSA